MRLIEPMTLSPKQIEYRNRIRAKGRKHYIVYTGILGWGSAMFVVTTLWTCYDKYGWHIPPRRDLWLSVILGVVIWPVAGYSFGSITWKRWFENPSS